MIPKQEFLFRVAEHLNAGRNWPEIAEDLGLKDWTSAQKRATRIFREAGYTVADVRAGVTGVQLLESIIEGKKKGGFEVTPLPDPEVPVEKLIEQRKQRFRRKKAYEQARKLINIQIKVPGPVGILHFGDPHVDDDGTDLDLLFSHVEIVNKTEGLFGGNVGDTTNNWVGRLAKLYAEQGTTSTEAWRIAEYFVRSVDWLYMIGGNHDAWSGAGDPLKWISRQQGCLYEASEARLGLRFKGRDEPVIVNVRHDFAGHSQWNPAHGSMKAAQMGTHDHILVNGHRHVSGYGIIKCPATGRASHCIQVASYKIYDRYQREKGFRDQHLSPAVLTVIDPDKEDGDVGLVTVFHDVGEGAEYLAWKRRST